MTATPNSTGSNAGNQNWLDPSDANSPNRRPSADCQQFRGLTRRAENGVRRAKAALFPVGVSTTRQPLQPEATGAAMEVTKWLKPSVNGVLMKAS
jgi:hypothetical protein